MGRGDLCLLEAQAKPGSEVQETAFDQREIISGALKSQKLLLPSVLFQAQVHFWVNGTVGRDKSLSWREARVPRTGRKTSVSREGQ